MVQVSYKVRPCRFEDLSRVISINESTLPENYPTYFYEQILEKYPNSFIVAELLSEKESRIVGYIMWRLERGISSYGIQLVKKGHLVSIAVLDGFRRNKIATSMIKKSIGALSEKYNPEEYVLEVRVSNTGAITLYKEKFHFEKTRVIQKYYRDGEDAYYMTLKRENIDFL